MLLTRKFQNWVSDRVFSSTNTRNMTGQQSVKETCWTFPLFLLQKLAKCESKTYVLKAKKRKKKEEIKLLRRHRYNSPWSWTWQKVVRYDNRSNKRKKNRYFGLPNNGRLWDIKNMIERIMRVGETIFSYHTSQIHSGSQGSTSKTWPSNTSLPLGWPQLFEKGK